MPTPSAKRPRKSAPRKRTATNRPGSKRGLSATSVPARGFKATAPQNLFAKGLEDGGSPDAQLLDVNVPGLGRNAANAMERHLALEHAVSAVWAVEDIASLQRDENSESFKWVMWRR